MPHLSTLGEQKRRPRTVFTQELKDILEKAFKEDAYPSYEVKKKLSEETELEIPVIESWFKRTRSTEKGSTEKGV